MGNPTTIEGLAAWLRAQDDFLILGHVSPDGDATGSALAIRLALEAMGKRAVVCLPGGIARMYAWLPGADGVLETGASLPFAPKAALSVDVSDPPRLTEAGNAAFEAAPRRAVLDHHATNEGFGDLWFVDGEAAACGELVLDLLDALGAPVTRDIADCLFVAISTDCGNFSYTNTRPQTLRAAARCLEAGIDIANLTERLYRTRSLGRTRLTGAVLDGLEISEDGRLAWARLTEAMLERCAARREDNEGIVNYLLEIDGVVCAVLAEQRGEKTKFSLRSKPPLNVADAVARPFGGGGHDCAAGCTLDEGVEEALPKVLELARGAIAALGD